MDKIAIALSALLMLAMVIIISPGILAMNRGKILRNAAIWLAVFTALALGYKTLGPGSPHPMFNMPDGIAMRYNLPPANKADTDKNDDAHDGFTPPKD